MGQHGVQKPEKLIVCCVSACYLSTDINAIPHYRFTAVVSYPVWQGASLTGDKYPYSKKNSLLKITCSELKLHGHPLHIAT